MRKSGSKDIPHNIDANSVSREIPWWKTKRTKIVGFVMVALFITGFFIWLFNFHPYVSTDDARVDADLIRVANLGASQQIERVYVDDGSWVTQGMLLVELDHRSAKAHLDRARAQARHKAGDLNRAEALARQNGISMQELDRIRTDAEASAAELKLAQIALDNTYLKSPVEGVVVQKLAKEGNVLEMNQTAITVVDIMNAWVSANIEETDVGLVKRGQKVYISVDEGGSLTGTVIDVRKAAAAQFALIPPQNAQGNFIKLVQRIPIKVKLDTHPGRILRVGQSVEIRVRVR